MSEPYSPFYNKLFKLLDLAERIFLGATIVALLLRRMEMEIGSLLIITMGGLAAVYFLKPQQRIEHIQESEGEQPKLGFADLLIKTTIPKVGWIGCSVAVVGILFSFQGFNGSQEMLLIAGGTLGIASLVLTYAVVTGTKTLTPLLMRAVPLFLICVVLLSKSGFFG